MKKFSLHLFTVIFLIAGITSCKKTGPDPDPQPVLLQTKQFSGTVATDWFTLLENISRTRPFVPGPTARINAYAGLALYESVVPGMPSYQSMYKYLTGNEIPVDKKKNYYWPACANAALARIITKLHYNYSATPNLAAIVALETSFNVSFQAETTPEQLQMSNEFGREVADIIYNWSTTDGTLNPDGTLAVCPPYVPVPGPGNWVPTPPGFFPAAGACQGNLRPFIANVGQRTLTLSQPPPVYSTDPNSDFYKMAKELYDISLNLSPDDINISQNWRDFVGTNYNGPARFHRLLADFIKKENLTLDQAAIAFAKNGIAVSDAIIAAFYSKFQYKLIRPITYIRNVMGYATWNGVIITPQTPSYTSVSGFTAAAFAEIVDATFGPNYSFTDSLHQSLYGSWKYNSVQDFLKDCIRSRTHSGINFRQAVEDGIKMGKNVGIWVNAFPFKK